MTTITHIEALEVLDSRGNPTVCVRMSNGTSTVYATVPSGASTGSKEALELRDGGKRYHGKGVRQAVANVNEHIAPLLIGKSADDQQSIDEIMCNADATDNKAHFGANAMLAVSLANVRLAAAAHGMPLFRWLAHLFGNDEIHLPVPMMNVINGGEHADNPIDIQEFMLYPHGLDSFRSALQAATEVFHTLKAELKRMDMVTAVGDEGGFAPNFTSTKQVLDALVNAIETAGYKPGDEIALTLDVAASELYENNKYRFKGEGQVRSAREMADYMSTLSNDYPIVSIEDPMHEEDWHGWRLITDAIGEKVQLVGDDLFVTNPAIFAHGIQEKVANAILIKLNQIGTLSETFTTIQLAKENNYNTIISHRSGESCDTFIADLAVATASGQIKTGSVCRSERVAKYNQLLWIAHDLGTDAMK